jgi:magnesium-transporting ATPase (P-type)
MPLLPRPLNQAIRAIPQTAAGERKPTGLTNAEAAERLREHGANVLPSKKPRPALYQFVAQMAHFFALMLWIAGFLAFLAGMPQLGVAIFAVIVLNGIFAFVQEYRAERAHQKLRDLLPRRTTVFRDGALVETDAAGLVIDDVIRLQAGDRIAADARVLSAFSLSIDVSTLTGESEPISVYAGDAAFAGTFVVEGQGDAVVIATGNATRLGNVARLAHRQSRPTKLSLNQDLRSFFPLIRGGGECPR